MGKERKKTWDLANSNNLSKTNFNGVAGQLNRKNPHKLKRDLKVKKWRKHT